MLESKLIETSREVWAVIQARHGDDLVIFATYTNTTDDEMTTAYGFKDAGAPLLSAETRKGVSRFWLHAPQAPDAD